VLKEGDIPNSVTHLTFGYYFNQELTKGSIPNSVTHLTFGYFFNQVLKEGVIPNSVTYLTFGYYFNQKLNYIITDNLIELLVSKNYTQTYLKLNKDILIGYIDNESNILYVKYNIKLNYSIKKEFDNYILNIELKGKLIMKELVEKVFHPKRLFKICNSYKIEFIELIDIYS